MKDDKNISVKIRLALLILPILYGIISAYCYNKNGSLFASYPDPAYAYLINGMNIAEGNFGIGHYDHPGTPVQLICGAVIFTTHLFVGEGSVHESVLSNPEFYLRMCVGFIALLFLFSIYLSGRKILKYTGNIFLALFFQLLPICSFFAIHYLLLIRTCPEEIVLISIIYYYAFLWVLCYRNAELSDYSANFKKQVLFFSFISALLITTKIVCLPLLVIPLFFIKAVRLKILYGFLTVFFTAIIIFPIWSKLPAMYAWFTKLATHSGVYGNGEEGVTMDSLITNLIKLFKFESFFTIGYALITVFVIAGFIMKKRQNPFYKLIVAIWLVCSGQLMLACKQFGHHYLLASQLAIIPGFLAAVYLFISKENIRKYVCCAALLVCFTLFGFNTAETVNSYKKGNKIVESSFTSKKYEKIPKIITTDYQGSCFPESALHFGYCYGGENFYASTYFLRTQYPNSYFYHLQLTENVVRFWDIPVPTAELFEKTPQLLFYFIDMHENEEKEVLNKFTNGFANFVKKIERIEYNNETKESFYMITIDTTKKVRYQETTIFMYDFETKTRDGLSFVSAGRNNKIDGTTFASTEKSISGSTSIKITHEESFNTILKVTPGDALDISVKYYSKMRPLGISLNAANPEKFYKNIESITEDYGNGWKVNRLQTRIPLNYQDSVINLCLFYWGESECYADDLKIVVSKLEKSKQKVNVNIESQQYPLFLLKGQNNKYVVLNSENCLVEDQADETKAENFQLIALGNKRFALRTKKGKYVSADKNYNETLFANRNVVKDWESFLIISVDRKKIKLISSSGNTVFTDQSNKNILTVNPENKNTDGIFEIIYK